jgi:hypothetical protein
MSSKENTILQLTKEAIERGEALKVSEIRSLRAESNKAAGILKGVFWVGIAIFNIALWAPLPIAIDKTILYVVAFSVLVIAVVVPIVGLRKHNLNLELLKVNKEPLKKKTANEAGRVYIDKVNKADRPFINAEYELLYGSKWEKNS